MTSPIAQAATQRTLLLVDDLEAGLDHPDYAGYGYLGERGRVGRMAIIETVDLAVLDRAMELGWTPAELAAWTISRLGRWYADETFGSTTSTAYRANPSALAAQAATAARRYMIVRPATAPRTTIRIGSLEHLPEPAIDAATRWPYLTPAERALSRRTMCGIEIAGTPSSPRSDGDCADCTEIAAR